MANDHEQIRATIVEAAREVFSRYGYKKTTLDDIASSLYRAKSSIYYYFKSKEDVFRAVIEYEANRARRIVKEAVAKETVPEEKIRVYCKTILKFYKETASYYKLIQEEILDVLSFTEEVKQKHDKESVDFFASILKEGIDDGSFAITSIDSTIKGIRVALLGLFSPYQRSEEFSDEELDAVLDILFNGIKKR